MNAKTIITHHGTRLLRHEQPGHFNHLKKDCRIWIPGVDWRRSGFTLIESCIATAITGLSLLALFDTNAYQIRLVKSTRETNAASLTLQERIESMRVSNWRHLTDASYVQGTLFATATKSSGPLASLQETLTISAYPNPSVCEPLNVVHQQGSNAVINTAGTGLSRQRIARVDLSVTWRSTNGQTMERASSTLISNSGVSRLNLTSGTTTPPPASAPPPTSAPGKSSNPHGNTGGSSGKG